MERELPRHTIVLLGVGHTNAHVLRMWKMHPIDNASLVCVSQFPTSTYSGMMPGVLAGQYSVPAMEIDLVRLCGSAGARLILGEVTGIDHEQRELQFADRPPLGFDVLSIGVGSRPSLHEIEVSADAPLIAIKPMQTFLGRLRERLGAVHESGTPPRIAVVGGGVGSLEIAFCLDQRLISDPESMGLEPNSPYELLVVSGSKEIGDGLLPSTRQRLRERLEQRGIAVVAGQRVERIDHRALTLTDGTEVPANVVIWATSAVAPPLLSQLGLKQDVRGFLRTDLTLQTLEHPGIFAVGDCGAIVDHPLPKAGVYAVRQGPVLWDNIRRHLWGRKTVSYRPQSGFLKLINTADGRSIAEYGGRSFSGRWCWSLKNRIDQKFMRMYQDYQSVAMAPPAASPSEGPMPCLGCGGKLGGQLLSQVLESLEVPPHPDVIIGLEHPDDAAVIRTHNHQVTATTDFFASPLEDPYLTGRIALLNSASDCFVMGAQPTAALAMVQIPRGSGRAQYQVMRELMAGALEELKKMNATLVGGHSIEGPRLTAGFTVLARQLTDPLTKGQLQPGDQLILTKPLGTGVLLAALMQHRLPGPAYQELLQAMLQSNQIALELAQTCQLRAMTDVTGFGLAGHLVEMLTASRVSARLEVDQIPLLPLTYELIQEGIESTLAPENRNVLQRLKVHGDAQATRMACLFDPQTCGGLLLGVAPGQVESVLQRLRDHAFSQAAVIGRIEPNGSSGQAELSLN